MARGIVHSLNARSFLASALHRKTAWVGVRDVAACDIRFFWLERRRDAGYLAGLALGERLFQRQTQLKPDVAHVVTAERCERTIGRIGCRCGLWVHNA
jgi:hypothetical protein